jgi:hypothetical protein
MHRRTLLVALAGLAVVVAAGTVVFWPRPDRITRENYARVHEGMTQADVEAILGPPGDSRTGPTLFGSPTERHDLVPLSRILSEWPEPVDPCSYLHCIWASDSVQIEVGFHTKMGAYRATCRPLRSGNQSVFDNLLWRAKRQWRRWFPE